MRWLVPALSGCLVLLPSAVFAQQATAPAATTAEAPATPAPEAPAASGETPATTATTPNEAAAPAAPAAAAEEGETRPSVTFHGTVEAAYSYNFNDPSNRVTAWRYYDTRHNLIGLQNALLSTEWAAGPASGHVQLQLGAFHELFWPGERSVEEDLLWRLIQEATVEWHTPWEKLSIEGGVFNVPFGPEYNVAYLNWNWSADNLFAIMPFQIAGFRANYDIGHGWTARLGVYNGWDAIVTDNNEGKSVLASLEYEDPDDDENYFTFNYMVGDERGTDDPRGPYARHTFDVYGQWHPKERLYLRGHVFAGFEPGRVATDGWLGVALFAKFDVHRWFSIAARGDVVRTFAGEENMWHADNLDDPTQSTLLGSGTLTLDFHPVSFASLRLEARHDRADFPLFYRGSVTRVQPDLPMGAPAGTPLPAAYDQANDSNQTTVTVGLTTWF